MTLVRSGLTAAAALLLVMPAEQQPQYDVILRGGLIIDGTGASRFTGDVAVQGGRIVRVGRIGSARGVTELDVRGLVVAPGFVNVHSHAQPSALPTAVNMLTQGVTTELINADGGGPTNLDVQFAAIEPNGLAVNVAASIGFNSIWREVVGLSDRRPGSAEIEAMRGLVAANLARGAFGVSSGLDYKPAYYATTDEVVAVLEPARQWRTFFPNHDRVIPETGFSARAGVEETRDIGFRAGIVPTFTHMKVQGHEQGSGDIVLGMMNRSSAEGRWIAADVYPYLSGQTGLGALIIPGWAADGGTDSMRARFRDPALRARIIAESNEAIKARFNGPETILVLGTRKLSDIMQERGIATPGEAVVTILETEMPWAILGFGVESDLVKLLQYHSMAVACDCGASTSDRGHPRGYGTYPRVLGRYVREQRVMTWEDAIRKMSGFPAALMGLVDRGLIAPGMAADIVVFDSATVIDHATFEQPTLLSDGIRHVLVNGVVALRDGKATGDKGGRILRRTGAMPSRPLDLDLAMRVEATGTLTDLDGSGSGRVAIALRQARGSQRATGTFRVTMPDGAPYQASLLGTLQTINGWASITGVVRKQGETAERAFTLVVDGADPFADGRSTVRLWIDGVAPVAGHLGSVPTIVGRSLR